MNMIFLYLFEEEYPLVFTILSLTAVKWNLINFTDFCFILAIAVNM